MGKVFNSTVFTKLCLYYNTHYNQKFICATVNLVVKSYFQLKCMRKTWEQICLKITSSADPLIRVLLYLSFHAKYSLAWLKKKHHRVKTSPNVEKRLYHCFRAYSIIKVWTCGGIWPMSCFHAAISLVVISLGRKPIVLPASQSLKAAEPDKCEQAKWLQLVHMGPSGHKQIGPPFRSDWVPFTAVSSLSSHS